MNPALADILQRLNLGPGTYRCELPEHEIVIEVRPREPGATQSSTEQVESKEDDSLALDESGLMLDPWVELPGLKPVGTVIAKFAPPPSPDIPYIPAEDEEP